MELMQALETVRVYKVDNKNGDLIRIDKKGIPDDDMLMEKAYNYVSDHLNTYDWHNVFILCLLVLEPYHIVVMPMVDYAIYPLWQ